MNEPGPHGTTARRLKAVWTHGLAVVLGAWALSSHALQNSAPFRVTVDLQADTAQCTVIGAFGASVSVACSAGGLRFLSRPPVAGMAPEEEEAGTVTSWRRIKLDNGDYLLEMTVRW